MRITLATSTVRRLEVEGGIIIFNKSSGLEALYSLSESSAFKFSSGSQLSDYNSNWRSDSKEVSSSNSRILVRGPAEPLECSSYYDSS